MDFMDTPNMHNTCLQYAKKYGPVVKVLLIKIKKGFYLFYFYLFC